MRKTKIIAVLAAGVMMLSACDSNKLTKSAAIKCGDTAVTSGDIAVLTDLTYGQYGQGAGIDFKNIKDQQVELIKDVLEHGELAKAMGIELTEEEKNSALETRAYYAQSMGGYKEFEKYLTENGSSVASLDAIFTASMYASKLEEEVAKEFEGKEATDEELKKFYDENYYCAKHILINKPEEGAEVVEGEKQGEELANELLERAKNGEDFDAMITEYSQDPGSATYPDGYVFTSGEMVEPFENKVKELKSGEFGICESDYGYHVILRLDLPAFEDQKNTVSSVYPSKRIEKRIEELLKEHDIKVEVKQELIDSITEESIKKKASEVDPSLMQ